VQDQLAAQPAQPDLTPVVESLVALQSQADALKVATTPAV